MNSDDLKEILGRDSQVLLVTAHPDDGLIGAGALLMQLEKPQVVHATRRSKVHHEEGIRAMEIAGVPQAAIENLQIEEQQITFQMYELTLHLLDRLFKIRPTVLLTHSYEGGDADHDSVAFACQLAHGMYCAEVKGANLQRIEFAAYHGADGRFLTYEFIPHSDRVEYRHSLIPYEQQLKTEMLKTFKTQAKTLTAFLPPRFENFRIAPDYDFHKPPHSGRLFYERVHRGIGGASWRKQAKRVVAQFF